MVEYWHWASIHSGQETYWKGVLSHDLEPNRAYAEVSRTAHELEKIGTHLANLKIKNEVAILYSVDSANALDFMPFALAGPQWSSSHAAMDYTGLVHQFHRTLYKANVGVDFIFPEEARFSDYKLVIVPALYIASDDLLQRLSDYVKQGGHVLMTFKSGFCDENSMVRPVRAPGPLREATGFTYQEFSNLEKPLALKGDPLHAGAGNQVSYWAEFLMPERAQAIAYYDHPFFGQWPAITSNEFGSGTLTYEGTYLSDALQSQIVADLIRKLKLSSSDQQLPAAVRVKHGENGSGRRLHYYLNYSSDSQSFTYAYKAGANLLTAEPIASAGQLSLKPWDAAIVEEQ
jgi:beta-galactosidase